MMEVQRSRTSWEKTWWKLWARKISNSKENKKISCEIIQSFQCVPSFCGYIISVFTFFSFMLFCSYSSHSFYCIHILFIHIIVFIFFSFMLFCSESSHYFVNVFFHIIFDIIDFEYLNWCLLLKGCELLVLLTDLFCSSAKLCNRTHSKGYT